MTNKQLICRVLYELVYWTILVGFGIYSGLYVSKFCIEVLNSSTGTVHKAFHDTNAANEN